jgi:hypothetical protein
LQRDQSRPGIGPLAQNLALLIFLATNPSHGAVMPAMTEFLVFDSPEGLVLITGIFELTIGQSTTGYCGSTNKLTGAEHWMIITLKLPFGKSVLIAFQGGQLTPLTHGRGCRYPYRNS